jgi:DNA-binding response OmpR family regulator
VLTILVVEDEFGVADVVVTALEDEGYRVLVAANGRQGMERIADAKPDLIILDFMMPIMDGAAMGKAVRALADGVASVPIIMTSAVSEAAVKDRFADFQAFLRKPFRIRELLETVEQLIGK